MAILKNNSGRARGVAIAHGRSVVLAAGESVRITNADVARILSSKIAGAWVDRKLISITSDIEIPQAPAKTEPAVDNDDDKKAQLIAELASFGVLKTKRSSVESLEAALDAVLSADEPSE